MSASARPEERPAVRELVLPSQRASVGAAVLLAVIGAAEILAVFFALRSRLPALVAWHFGFTGQPNGWASPALAVTVEVAQVAGISLVFVVMQWWIGRSVPLSVGLRGRLPRPLLALQGVIVVVVIPLVSAFVFATAAGVLPISDTLLGVGLTVLGVGAAIGIFIGLLWSGRGAVPTVAPSQTKVPRHAHFSVGGPIELVCPACGERYRLDGVPLFAPHMGVGRVGSLYLRCPRCGERGWNNVVGRVSA
jgi:hypothetical protein